MNVSLAKTQISVGGSREGKRLDGNVLLKGQHNLYLSFYSELLWKCSPTPEDLSMEAGRQGRYKYALTMKVFNFKRPDEDQIHGLE